MNRYLQLVMLLVVSALVGTRVEAQVAVRARQVSAADNRPLASLLPFASRTDTVRLTEREVTADEIRTMIGTVAPTSQSRHRAEIAGIAIGAIVGAVVGNEIAHDHRPVCEPTPGGFCVFNHPDHSTKDRWSTIGLGAVIGALVGGFVDR